MSTVFPFLESQGCSSIPLFWLLSCSFTCSPVVLTVSVPVCLSLSFALSVCVSVSLCLSLYLYFSVSVCLCLYVSVSVCLSLSVCLSVSLLCCCCWWPTIPTFSSNTHPPPPPSPQKVSNICFVERSIVFFFWYCYCWEPRTWSLVCAACCHMVLLFA